MGENHWAALSDNWSSLESETIARPVQPMRPVKEKVKKVKREKRAARQLRLAAEKDAVAEKQRLAIAAPAIKKRSARKKPTNSTAGPSQKRLWPKRPTPKQARLLVEKEKQEEDARRVAAAAAAKSATSVLRSSIGARWPRAGSAIGDLDDHARAYMYASRALIATTNNVGTSRAMQPTEVAALHNIVCMQGPELLNTGATALATRIHN